ncbi:hypothetical protein ABPG72_017643, partial [Tetrahymena utriculariae]
IQNDNPLKKFNNQELYKITEIWEQCCSTLSKILQSHQLKPFTSTLVSSSDKYWSYELSKLIIKSYQKEFQQYNNRKSKGNSFNSFSSSDVVDYFIINQQI